MLNTLQFRPCHDKSCKENSTCFKNSKKDQNLLSFPEMGSDQICGRGGGFRGHGGKLSILKQLIECLKFLRTDVSSLICSQIKTLPQASQGFLL